MLPQSIPAGSVVTVPAPRPFLTMRSVSRAALNDAETVRETVIGSVQSLVPLQSPLQPTNEYPVETPGVRRTEMLRLNAARQPLSPPQSIPGGTLVIEPPAERVRLSP